jgi:hypothetical protein
VIINFLKENFDKVKEEQFKQSPGKIANSLNIEAKYTAEIEWTNFYKRKMTVEVKAEDMEEVEVIKSGVKRKIDNGRITIVFSAELELDYRDKFEATPFKRKMRDIYKKVFDREIKITQLGPLDELVSLLQKKVKEHLGMETSKEAYP